MDSNDILKNYGGFRNNSLLEIVNHTNIDEDEPVIYEHSIYMGNEALLNTLKEKKKVFKVLALNCQSLYAKYDQLSIYVDLLQEQGCSFDAICLQETWLGDSTDTGPLSISGYNFISKPKTCSFHGGLAIYLKSGFHYRQLLGNLANFPPSLFPKKNYAFMFSLSSPKVTLPLPRPPLLKILDPPLIMKPVILGLFFFT